MTTFAQSLDRSRLITVVGVVGFAAALAAGSQVAIPIPGTPVPITLQPFLVVLAGMMLGPMAGAASMLLYIAAGMSGLPVWAPIGAPGLARLVGPTGGYIIAYPAAAWVAGALVRRSTSFLARWGAAVAGVLVLYLGGLAQLSFFAHGVANAVKIGITPFALLDGAKALVAAAITGKRQNG